MKMNQRVSTVLSVSCSILLIMTSAPPVQAAGAKASAAALLVSGSQTLAAPLSNMLQQNTTTATGTLPSEITFINPQTKQTMSITIDRTEQKKRAKDDAQLIEQSNEMGNLLRQKIAAFRKISFAQLPQKYAALAALVRWIRDNHNNQVFSYVPANQQCSVEFLRSVVQVNIYLHAEYTATNGTTAYLTKNEANDIVRVVRKIVRNNLKYDFIAKRRDAIVRAYSLYLQDVVDNTLARQRLIEDIAVFDRTLAGRSMQECYAAFADYAAGIEIPGNDLFDDREMRHAAFVRLQGLCDEYLRIPSLEDDRAALKKLINNDKLVDKIINDLTQKIEEAKSFGRSKIAVLNATFSGGGVAAMIPTLWSIGQKYGVDVEWYIIDAYDTFHTITKKYHNALQGDNYASKEGEFIFWEQVNQYNAEIYQDLFQDTNLALIAIEDPQDAPLISNGKTFMHKKEGAYVPLQYRLHIDMSGVKNDLSGPVAIFKRISRHLEVGMSPYETIAFQPNQIPGKYVDVLKAKKLRIKEVPPGINPLSSTNRLISDDELAVRLRHINDEHTIEVGGVRNLIDPNIPTISIGARYDKWKAIPVGAKATLTAIKENLDVLPPEGIQLIVFGNYATDDPEGVMHFTLIKKMVEKTLGDAALKKVNIVLLAGTDMSDVKAVYRLCAKSFLVYLAVSFKEGFNLMTDEASVQNLLSFVTLMGGLSRYEDGKDAFTVDVQQLVDSLSIDIAVLFKLLYTPELPLTVAEYRQLASVPDWQAKLNTDLATIQKIEDLIAAKMSEIIRFRFEDPEAFEKKYRQMADKALEATVAHSLYAMLSEYLENGLVPLRQQRDVAAAARENALTPVRAEYEPLSAA